MKCGRLPYCGQLLLYVAQFLGNEGRCIFRERVSIPNRLISRCRLAGSFGSRPMGQTMPGAPGAGRLGDPASQCGLVDLKPHL